MTNLKHEIETIKYAMENGFTEVQVTTQKDGSILFFGTFGYIEVAAEDAEELQELIATYQIKEVQVETFAAKLNKMFGSDIVIKNDEIAKLLPNEIKEVKVSKRAGKKTFYFEVEGNKNDYNALVAEQMSNGKWWVKYSTLRHK